MVISVLQENFLKALVRTSRIISTRASLPITQMVLLQAQEGELHLTTTNLETTESVWVGAKIEKEGGICLPSHLLTELVTSLPQETVHLSTQEGALKISCAGINATLPGVDSKEFPPVPAKEEKKALSVSKEALLSALEQVIFAAATDEGRPLLTGIKLHEQEKQTTLAATDGYRLSVKHLDVSFGGGLAEKVIPARALSEVIKIAFEEKETKEVKIFTGLENQLEFIIGATRIITRLISGEYPNYEKIIPTKYTTRALVDKEKLLRAVKSAAIFARDNANIIKLALDKQKIVVSANAPQTGESSAEVEAKIDGDGGEIAFNSRFLLEFLANFPEEEFLFEMTGSLNPGVFRPVKDESFLHIIMPVRLQS